MPAPYPRLGPATWMVGLLVVLAGCAGGPPPAPHVPPTRAEPRNTAPASLVPERQWLQSWFKGTPVVIAQRSDGAVSVDVPRAFCFDPGRSELKPALAAVLDKVAESLRRVPQARLPLIAAPDDAPSAAGLALARASQVHKHLLSRGVTAARLGKPAVTGAGSVQLRMETPGSAL